MTALPIEALETRRLLAFSPIHIGSKGYDSGFETAIDAQGNTIVAGIFAHTVNFGPAVGTGTAVKLTAVGETDIFVAKYDPNGNVIWAGRIGGPKGEEKNDLIDVPIDPARLGSFINGPGIQGDFLGEYVNGLALDSSGDVFLTGTFVGTADFDPGRGNFLLTANDKFGDYDAFLVKLAPNGGLDWADNFGGQFNDAGNAVAIDPAGNPIVTGYFTRTADFDPGPATFDVNVLGRDDVFVAKYTGAAGKFVWVDTFGSDTTTPEEREQGNGIAIDGEGNIFVTGTFAGKTDFDPGPATFILKAVKRTDTFLLELSPRGKRVFAESFGGKGFDGGEKVAVEGGAVYLASYFTGTVDVDPGPRTEEITSVDDDEHTDVLISKFTVTTGKLDWAKPIAGTGFETIGGFAVAADGSVYTSGGFWGMADFDPGPGTDNVTSVLGDDNFDDPNDSGRDNSYDIYVQRLSTNGKFLEATTIGSSGDDFGTGLALSADGATVALTGQFRNTVPFDPVNNKFKLKAVAAQDGFLIGLSDDLKLVV